MHNPQANVPAIDWLHKYYLAIQEMHLNLQLSTDILGNYAIFLLDDAQAFNSIEWWQFWWV